MARRKAQDFDTQAALERKTNEALKLAKAQAHVRDDEGETSATSSTPLVDRKCLLTAKTNFTLTPICSGLRRAELPEPDVSHWRADHQAA